MKSRSAVSRIGFGSVLIKIPSRGAPTARSL